MDKGGESPLYPRIFAMPPFTSKSRGEPNATPHQEIYQKEKFMYYQRDKLISLRISSKLLEKFKKLTDEKTEITHYANKNHHRYYGKTLKDRTYHTYVDKYSLADLLEEAIQILLEKNNRS